jgi:hypothetical protein
MLTTMRLGFAALASAALLTFAVVLPLGCSGGKETLVVAALTGQPDAPALDAATVTIGSTHKAFTLQSGLTSNAVNVGVYVPSSVSGPITVSVSATGGGLCYRGSASTTIVTTGAQVNVAVTLMPDTACGTGPDGGAGASGSGGTGGGGGSTGGSGGSAGGSGGSAGGTAGAGGGAGTGGSGGTGGAGGAAGAGGSAGAGGAGGVGGTGGVGGAGGVPQVLAWSAAENIEKDVLTASSDPTVAIDATHGNVLIGWVKGANPGVKRYDASKKMWSATKLLDNRGSINGAAVAMDDLGHAVTVWFQNDNNKPPAEIAGIWFAHSEDGGVSWSVPARIHNGPAWGDLALKMASDGSARLAWDETDGVTRTLWSASYSVTTQMFTGAAAVKMGSDVYERHARLAMSPKGPGVLVWIQRDGAGKDSVWGSSFATPGGALSTPVLVDANVDTDVYDPSVAIGPDGTHGIVAWDSSTATTDELWTADWTMAGGFVASTRAFSGSGVAAPGVAVDSANTVTMAWSQMLASGKWNVTAARRPSGAAWGAPMALETANQAGSFTDQYAYPSVAADGAGNVHVLWRRKINAGTNKTYGVFVRDYSGSVWAPEVSLGTKTGLPAFNEQLAVASDGRAAATFYFGDPDGVGDADAYNVFVALFK